MDKKEQEVYAQQHKDRVDLNERHAKVWGKFLSHKDAYDQKYGSAYATILLRQEKENLEAQFNQDHAELAEQHDRQWLVYHENESPAEQSTPLPSFPQEPSIAQNRDEKDINHNAEQPMHPLHNQLNRTLFSNPFKQVEHEQPQLIMSEANDIDQSQQYMQAMLTSQKSSLENEKETKIDQSKSSMSARYLQGLSSYGVNDQTDRSIERGKDIERD